MYIDFTSTIMLTNTVPTKISLVTVITNIPNIFIVVVHSVYIKTIDTLSLSLSLL